MKKTKSIEANGSITKKESLTPIEYKILENTFVAESGDPYKDYYGEIPHRLAPNSLFLFTKKFYKLDEILKITCDIKDFLASTKKLDVATSILDFTDHYHYAIRVKDFPDYIHIHWLQTCLSSEGVIFIKKVHIPEFAQVTIFKNFTLDEIEKGIYMDKNNDHKGYILIPRQINNSEFSDILIEIRNNNDCELFDAAIGTIDVNSNPRNMIRIYSENLNIGLLKCIKQKVLKSLVKEELHEH